MIYTLIVILAGIAVLCFIRVWRGPTMADRMVAVDMFGILVVGITPLLALLYKREFLIDIGLAWIFISFIGTIALAKYLEGRKFDE